MKGTSRSCKVVGYVEQEKTYLCTMTPPAAKDLLFVSTYDDSDPLSNAIDQHGYQRPPMSKRFKEIAGYFQKDENASLITPLIVSVRLNEPSDIDQFLKLLNEGDLAGIKESFGKKVASIVDGQHRFYGLHSAWEANQDFLPPIPVMLYFGLTFIREANLFNTINATQRKLPKALIETTKGDITETDALSYAQRIRRLTFSLCRDTDSVWGPVNNVEQINMTGVRDPNRRVTYEGLRRSTSNMFPRELLDQLEALDADIPKKYAKRYWRAVSEACMEAWNGNPSARLELDPMTGESHEVKIHYRIKDLVGVASLAKLGKDIILNHVASGSPTKIEDLTNELMHVDWEKRADNPWMRSQAGFAGQKELFSVLHAWVFSGRAPEGATQIEEAMVD